ncbi:MAG: carbamate kinase [Deltaproteobacteria bacterium]|nr:carbamate kinase [Deltaproteobacteria bacterium]
MRLVVALGGNALLRRHEPLTHDRQRANVRRAAAALAPLARDHALVVTHGNGPQIGLLALQQESAAGRFPLDVLGAQTEGMIGYLLEQALDELLPKERLVASLLTRVLVDARDPAFASPSKFVGPSYASEEAARALEAKYGWRFRRDGADWRRVVPSPRPLEILEQRVIALLLERGVTLVCGGGGGIPVLRDDAGHEVGVEAVVDKDHASALLAGAIGADGLLLLTDVPAVALDFGQSSARAIRHASPAMLADFAFPAGSMGPKVEAACAFVSGTGGFAAIGALEDAGAILAGERGTRIDRNATALVLESAVASES